MQKIEDKGIARHPTQLTPFQQKSAHERSASYRYQGLPTRPTNDKNDQSNQSALQQPQVKAHSAYMQN